jgi:hypothetical protein
VQRAYIDGFVEEELLEFQGSGAPPQPRPDGTFEVPATDPVMAGDAALRRMGLRVIDGG